jgi:hypothetical protein
MFATGAVKPAGPHQRFIDSLLEKAFHTFSMDALNVRVIVIV